MNPAPWTGWLRRAPCGRWAAVCHAATWSDCWGRLLDAPALDDRPGTVERVVLEAHRHPAGGPSTDAGVRHGR